MPLSPSQTRELLGELEHLPNKKLGQNFLVDGNIVRKSVELAGVGPDSRVVEVGPGLGTLTRALLETGAEVWAVERDPTLATHIRNQIAPDFPKLHLTEGDCLDSPLADLPARQACEGFKIVANLPYAVSTPWMDAVLAGPLPQSMVLMLQKEAADRYHAPHGKKSFGAISIFLQSAYEIHSQHVVSAACFYPPPKVDSALVRFDLKDRPVVFPREARDCIRRLFTQRRKQLGALCRKDPHPPAATWFEHLLQAGLPTTVRPEAIPVEAWQGLAGS
ncbi:MAG: 16S rRNA (adenine(1518)-N(6)/adenine(1519)-N(6))-dimethyltransferase RsmA [Opitutales bacterium]